MGIVRRIWRRLRRDDFSFVWQNGALGGQCVAALESPLTRFDRWTGKGTIAKSALTLTSGGISREAKTSALRGSITFDRDLDLTLETRRGAVKIGWTLAQAFSESREIAQLLRREKLWWWMLSADSRE